MRALGHYPSSFGAANVSVFPHVGPVSYVQTTPVVGTIPAAGGDRVQAGPEAGFKFFDTLFDGTTDDGVFRVVAFPLTKSNPAGQGSSILSGIPSQTYGLKWISNITGAAGGQAQTAGAEAVAGTNLSTFCVKLTGLGI